MKNKRVISNTAQKILDMEINPIINRAIDKINLLMREEFHDFYKELIDEFYSYETQSYVRTEHEPVGSRKGNTLYLANKTQANNHNKNGNQKLVLSFYYNNADWVHNYEPHYQHGTPQQVLDYIFQGKRFFAQLSKGGVIEMPWALNSGEYNTINEAIDYFATTIFKDRSQQLFDKTFVGMLRKNKGIVLY